MTPSVLTSLTLSRTTSHPRSLESRAIDQSFDSEGHRMLEGPGFSVNVGEEIARGIEVGLHEINQNQSRFFAVAEFLSVDACVVFVSVFAHWLGPITRGFSIRVMNLRSIQMKHLLSFECAR